MDCDLYSSTVTVLEFIQGLIRKDTVLVFDDWYSFNEKDEFGEKRAFREWNHAKYFEEFYDVENVFKAFICTEEP